MDGVKFFFVGAKSGKSQKSGNEYGLVELVIVTREGGRTVTEFCDPPVAEAARRSFKALQEVRAEYETVVTGAGMRANLVGLVPVEGK